MMPRPRLPRTSQQVSVQYDRSTRGPLADGDFPRLPHRVRRNRNRNAPDDGAGRVAVAPQRRARIPGAGAAVGQGGSDPVRRGRSLGHGAIVRARTPLARVHEVRRPDRRRPILARRVRLLHRGDLPRRLSLRVGPALAARALACRDRRRSERRRVGSLRAHGQRVDEHPHRRDDCRGNDRSGGSGGRHAEPGRVPAGAAHGARRLRVHRPRRGGSARVDAAARRGARLSPQGAHRGALGGRAGRCVAAALRRHQRPSRRQNPTGEAGCSRGAVRQRARCAASRRRLARRAGRDHAVRAGDSARPVAPRVPRVERRGEGPRRIPAPRLAAAGAGACELPDHGRARDGDGAGGAVGGLGWVAQARDRGAAVAVARAGGRRSVRVHRHRSGVDGHGNRTPTVGGARTASHLRRRDADARAHRAPHRVHAPLPRAGRGGGRVDRRDGARHGRRAGGRCERAARGDRVTGMFAIFGLPEFFAGIIVVALNVYVLTGGADFGGGVWDLLATGPRRDRQRDLIAGAIGPIWEANHVWLVLVVVLTFTAFPAAFATLGTVLHLPLALMLVGIVMRGSAFVFRSYGSRTWEQRRRWGRIFAVASTLTPLLLGLVIGSISTGAVGVPQDQPGAVPFRNVYVAPWWSPFPIAVGVLALALFAMLAAVYLAYETRDDALREDFRRRALAAAAAVFVAAFGALAFAHREAPMMRAGLVGSAWALPFQIATGVAALTAIGALWRRRYALARFAAAAQVSLILWGWALAQFPYVVPPSLTIRNTVAPRITLVLVAWALAAGAVLLIPSLIYLRKTFATRQAR